MGMTKKLLIVFASGLVISVLSLSSAWVLGGDALIKQAGEHGKFSIVIDDDDDDRGPRTSREFTFDPATPLTVTTPVSLQFTRGETTSMTVHGSRDTVNALRWENGKLSVDDAIHVGGSSVKVEVTAPHVPAMEFDAPSKVRLEGLDQPELAVESNGAVDLRASGKVARLKVESRGAGKINLEDVDATDASIDSKGVGDVIIAASGKVDVRLDGAGRVKLKRRPAEFSSTIHGVGAISHDY